MLREAQAENLYIITGYTDMRKGTNGLLQIIQGQYNLDPYTDSLFLFCGRNARKLKALYWEGDGFLLLSKSLSSEEGRYRWPRSADEARNLSREEFTWLMQGLSVDQPKAIRKTNTKYDFFADTERGAEASARVFSVIETAKMNGLDVYGYLVFLLSELPKLGKEPTREQLDPLFPWSNTLPDYCKNQSKN